MEWEVVEADPRDARATTAAVTPTRRRRLLAAVGLLALLVALSGWGLRDWLAQQEARIEADVTRAVQSEEAALRFGLADQAAELARPGVSQGWLERYRRSFTPALNQLSAPEVERVERRDDEVLVTLRYEDAAGNPWASARGYRLTDDGWRRSTVTPDWWRAVDRHDSDHFTLALSDRDAALLDPTQTLEFLESFRAELARHWPGLEERRVEIELLPFDLHDPFATRVEEEGERLRITLNSPLLVPVAAPHDASPLRGYRYAMALAVAQLIAPAVEGEAGIEQRVARQLLVRALLLTPEEREAYRAALFDPGGAWVTEMDRFRLASLQAEYLLAEEGLETMVAAATDPERRRALDAPGPDDNPTRPQRLADRALLWGLATLNGPGAPTALAREISVEIVQRFSDAPTRFMVRFDDAPHTNVWIPPVRIAGQIPPECLGPGTRLRLDYRLDGVRGRLDYGARAAVIAQRLPPVAADVDGAPGEADLLVARVERGVTTLVALDGRGREVGRIEWPGARSLTLDPDGPTLAVADEGECGSGITLSRIDPVSGRLALGERHALRVGGSPHLLWLGGTLYVVDVVDFPTIEQPEGWYLSQIDPEQGQGNRFHRRLRTIGWGAVVGRDAGGERALLRLIDGTVAWLYPARWPRSGEAVVERVGLRIPPKAEQYGFSPNGRWLLYGVTDEQRVVQLFALDTTSGESRMIGAGDPDTRYDAALWHPESDRFLIPLYAPDRDETLLVTHRLGPFGWTRESLGERVAGAIQPTRWCSGERVLFRYAGERELYWWEGAPGPVASEGGIPLWCR